MWQRAPRWLLVGGITLAFTAGFVNAVGYSSVAARGVSHVTGQVTQWGIDLAQGAYALALNAVLLVAAFFGGAVLSGLIVRRRELAADDRPYGIALLTEALLLAVGGAMFLYEPSLGEVSIAAAMGLQNALASTYSGAVVRTTHVTGLVTDVGVIVGRALRGDVVDAAKLKLLVSLLAAFVVGAGTGAYVFACFGMMCVFAPAVWIAAMAMAWIRRQQRRGETLIEAPAGVGGADG